MPMQKALMGFSLGPEMPWLVCLTVLLVATPTVCNPRFSGKKKLKEALHEHHLDKLYDADHGVKMGVSSEFCDDGETKIEVDWNQKSEPTEEMRCDIDEYLKLVFDGGPINITEKKHLQSQHICLPDKIKYPTDLPLSGPHRPLWPKFGEYKYLPPTRWVHSLEHGAIVFLYHPCVKEDFNDVTNVLKGVLRDCLWKHIISPYRNIPDHMPYALLSYGHAMLFGPMSGSEVDPEHLITMVKTFIKEQAFKAPETHVLKNGQYSAEIEKGTASLSEDKAPNEILCDVP